VGVAAHHRSAIVRSTARVPEVVINHKRAAVIGMLIYVMRPFVFLVLNPSCSSARIQSLAARSLADRSCHNYNRQRCSANCLRIFKRDRLALFSFNFKPYFKGLFYVLERLLPRIPPTIAAGQRRYFRIVALFIWLDNDSINVRRGTDGYIRRGGFILLLVSSSPWRSTCTLAHPKTRPNSLAYRHPSRGLDKLYLHMSS